MAPRLTILERTRLRKEKEAAAAAAAASTTARSSSPSRASSPTRSLPRSSSPPRSDFILATPSPHVLAAGSRSNTVLNRTSVAQRKSMGERILKKIKLENDSQAEFTQFIETSSQEERDALQVAYTLRLSDIVAKSTQEAVTTWTPPKSLEKTLRPLIYSLLLMPNIKYYSGNLTSILMTVARDAGTKQLPKDDDDSDALASWLNKETNNAKYVIKKTITESIASGSDIENIADLTHKLLTSHAKHFNATLSLYFRIALIRSHIGKHEPKQFWGQIDEELETQIYKGGPEAVVDNFKTLYEEDVEKHGDPADSKHVVSSEIVGEKRPKWYQSMNLNAPRVQRVKATRTVKRRRDDSDDENDDDIAVEQENVPPEGSAGSTLDDNNDT